MVVCAWRSACGRAVTVAGAGQLPGTIYPVGRLQTLTDEVQRAIRRTPPQLGACGKSADSFT